MHEITRPQLALYLAASLAVGLLGAKTLHQSAGAAQAGGAGAGRPAPVRVGRAGGGAAVVHVAGAVRHPGVYRLREGDRIQDAVRRAGGPSRSGDVNAINLAARVADGQQVVVPARATAVPAAAPAGVAGAGGAVAAAPATPVDLNTATAEQLDQLDGVGPATAQKILAFRQEHGGFRSVDDLGNVAGIGPKRLAALRPHVRA